MRIFLKEHSRELACYGMLLFVGFGLHAFYYYPMLDDFIQYRVYGFYSNPVRDVILRIGLLSSRPLAGFLDVFFFSRFWNDMRLAFVLILILYFLSGVFLYYLANRYFKCGFAFLAIYGLTPFVCEGVLWLSASSRTVVSVFFASLCAVFLQAALDKKSRVFVFLYFLFNLLSFSLYEQGIVFSFSLCIMILFFNKARSISPKNITLWMIPFINGMIIGYFYLFVRTGSSLSSSRINLADFSQGYLQHLIGVCYGIYKAVVLTGGKIITEGFKGGLYTLVEQKKYLYSAVILAVFILCAFLLRENKNSTAKGRQAVWGILLFLLPFFPFFVLQNSAVTLRTTFCSLFGMALLFDFVFRLLVKRKTTARIIFLALAFVLTMGRVYETDNYYKTGKYDSDQLNRLVSTLPDLNKDRKIALIGPPEYYPDTGVRYYEHIYSVTSSQWALSGALRAVSEDRIQYGVYPIWADKEVYGTYSDLSMYDGFYGYTQEGPVSLTRHREGTDEVFYDKKDREFARIEERNGNLYCSVDQ